MLDLGEAVRAREEALALPGILAVVENRKTSEIRAKACLEITSPGICRRIGHSGLGGGRFQARSRKRTSEPDRGLA